MKKVLLAALILIVANSEIVFAQNADIILTNVSLTDTSNLSQTVAFPFSIQNISLTDTITAFIEVKAREKNYGHNLPDQITGTTMIFPPGFPYPFATNTLLLDQLLFAVGDNVVVIWPLVDGIPGDSIFCPIRIYEANGLINLELKNKLFISSSSKNQFQIHNLSQASIQHINIFDLSAKAIMQFDGDKNQFQLDAFSRGIYLLEITLSDGKKGVFKIFIE